MGTGELWQPSKALCIHRQEYNSQLAVGIGWNHCWRMRLLTFSPLSKMTSLCHSLSTLVLVKHLISCLIWIKELWFYLLSFWYIYIYIFLTLWTSFKIATQNILTFQFLPLIETLKFMLFQFILKMELELIHIYAYSKFYPKAMTDHQKMCVYQYTVLVDFCTDTLNKESISTLLLRHTERR